MRPIMNIAALAALQAIKPEFPEEGGERLPDGWYRVKTTLTAAQQEKRRKRNRAARRARHITRRRA